MTTYTNSVVAVNFLSPSTVGSFAMVPLVLIVPDSVTQLSYTKDASNPNDFDDVTFNNQDQFYSLLIDGISEPSMSGGTGAEASFGQVAWSDGGVSKTTYVLSLENLDTGVEYLFVVGGDAFPTFSSAAEFNSFLQSQVTGLGPAGPSSGFASGDLFPISSIPGVIVNQNDLIIGTSGNDTYNAGVGDDTIGGRGGNDNLMGGDGNDWLYGEGGVDIIDGGADTDRIWGGADGDAIGGGSGNDFVYGESGDDWLYGNSGSDSIDGGLDNDRIWGGSEADTLGGGEGDDWLYGEDGNDWLYGNAGNDNLSGDQGNDVLFAIDGLNAMGGGAGMDTLHSGYNSDWSWGGADADLFHFAGWSWHDFIMDFEDGVDKIDLAGEGWGYTSTSQFSIVDDAGGNAFISLGFNTWISVIGVSSTQLTDADFMF